MLLTPERAQLIERLAGVSVAVLLDGEDVTRDCFAADDALGYVQTFLRGDDGRLQLNANRTAVLSDYRHGVVTFRWSRGGHVWT